MSTTQAEFVRKLENRAKKQLKAIGTTKYSMTHSPEETQKMFHELQVHQIELEMQNEELRHAIAEKENMEVLLGTFRDLYDFAPAGYFVLDHKGIILAVNLTGAGFLGIERTFLNNLHLDDFISNEMRPVFNDFLDKVFASESKKTCEVVFIKKNHTPIFVRIEAAVSESRKNCRAVVTDITLRKRAEEALRERENRFKNIFSHSPIGMAVMSLEGRFTLVNKSLCKITGYNKEELESITTQEITHPDDLKANLLNIKKLIDGSVDSYRMEKRYIRKDQQVVWAQITSSRVKNHDGVTDYLISQIEDITDRKRTQEQIHKLAYFDMLTSLPNSRLLKDRLNQSLAQARRYKRSMALMFLDLDNFKQVNDTLGHDIGDELLKIVAERLLNSVRIIDTVCRQGGDEFTIVLSEITHPDDAAVVAAKIINTINEPLTVNGNELNITTSIGIAVYPIDGIDDTKDLMKKADKAMYETKNNGRNGFTFYKELLPSIK